MLRILPIAAAAAVLSAMPLAAQEFRIYTRVYEGSAAGENPVVVTRSLSLFHAGKVYDYIDTLGEVTVFEPAQDRVHILDTQRRIATTVHFSQLHQLLSLARQETERHLAELEAAAEPATAAARAQLRFQLDPIFDEAVDETNQRVTLSSEHVRYTARCIIPDDPGTAATYLLYADWMCRLNFVLHPRSLFPDARLALNASLRRVKALPLEVDLEAELGKGIELRARHQIGWELDAKDRSLIHRWERMLSDPRTRRVSLHEYQRLVLEQ